LVKSGNDDEATKIIAGVINRLHFAGRSEFPRGLTPLLKRFQSLFDKANQDRDQGSIFKEGAAVARDLLSDQGPAHVLHGDIHHENIRQHRERGWLAIDPKGLIGDRAYDAANALCNPLSLPKIVRNRKRLLRQADIMAATLALDRERLLSYTFAHACLAACWSLEEDRTELHHFLAVAEIAQSCLNRSAHFPGNVLRNSVNLP
jgi:streptomycin 6-kinase